MRAIPSRDVCRQGTRNSRARARSRGVRRRDTPSSRACGRSRQAIRSSREYGPNIRASHSSVAIRLPAEHVATVAERHGACPGPVRRGGSICLPVTASGWGG